MTDQKALLKQQLIALLTQYIALDGNGETAVKPQQSDAVEMLTIKECAVLVPGLSEHTVRKLALSGKVASIRTGEGKNGKILVNKDSLLAYLNDAA